MDPPVTWRNRTRNLQIQTRAFKTMKTGSGAPVTTSNPTGLSGTYGLMADNNHPQYKKRRREGQIVMGDVLLQKNVQNYQATALQWTAGTTTCTLSGDFASQVKGVVTIPDAFTSINLSNLMDLELISAYAKINSETVMSGELLSDLAQTVSMLRAPFSSAEKHLARMLSHAQSKYRETADSVAQANASAWLEYRYGIVPLYLDINLILEIFALKHCNLGKHRTVVRSGKVYRDNKTVTFSQKALPILNNIGYQLYASGSVDCQRELAINSGVIYEVVPRTQADELAAQFQLGSSAVLPTAWEIVPFSFVADWFFNVGDWLSANNLPPGVTVLGNWTTAKKGFVDTYMSTDLNMTMNSVVRHGSWGQKTNELFVLDRRTNRPLPSLPVVVDKWSTVIHALDAASLALNPVKDLCQLLRK